MVLLLAGLAYLNWLFDLEKVLRTPLGFLRKIWLPLLVFSIYVLGWLGLVAVEAAGAGGEVIRCFPILTQPGPKR